jgi:hypothetical protein
MIKHIKDLFTKLTQKDDKFSKTSVILLITYGIVWCKYLFEGAVIKIGTWIDWTVPVSDPVTMGVLLGSVSTLYFANHNVTIEKT